VKRLFLTALMLLLLFGCDSYLEERLGFLELPFEYEGEFPGREYNLAWDLAWGVPDNGDDQGIYLGNHWGEIFYSRNDQLWSLLGSLNNRPIASLHSYEWLVSVDGSGPGETLRLYQADLASKILPALPSATISTLVPTGESLLVADGLNCYIGNVESDFYIRVVSVDTGGPAFNSLTDVLPAASVLLSDVISQAFPGADDTWGTPTVDFHAFAPASLASWEGEHKFIVSRSDGLTGRQKTVLVSINQSSYAMTTREISAQRDFHFVSRDRFVGMDGNSLVIFNADGDRLASHTLDGMRLLGYRSSTDRELVFLYTSDEDEGDRVWGIYSLPASFIEEAN